MPISPPVLILILLAIVAGGVVAWYLDRQRREALTTWALARGWRLEPGKVRGLPAEYPGLKFLQVGHSREGRNGISGTVAGRPVRLLDYRYETGNGKHRTTHQLGVAIMRTDFPVIPLAIRLENPGDRISQFFGAEDINFESAEFSRKFHVTSSDRKWAFDVIHPRVMERLLSGPGYSVSFGFQEIAVHKSGKFDPDGYEAALSLLADLYAMIPDYVVQQMKGQPR